MAKAMLEGPEEDLYEHYGIPTQLSETVRIAPSVRWRNGFRNGWHLPLQKVRELDFKVSSTSVQPPYDVYWKVKNTGREAAADDGLRGQIIADNRGADAWRYEKTKYRGDHYVEIFIVKDGICVAMQPLPSGDRVVGAIGEQDRPDVWIVDVGGTARPPQR
jgi:Adenylyl/Guanylyl and SMODS C-terminal sensor domain